LRHRQRRQPKGLPPLDDVEVGGLGLAGDMNINVERLANLVLLLFGALQERLGITRIA
jgi:hypothetical protein